MSTLGSTASPVSDTISTVWVIVGILIIIFGFGFRVAFLPANIYVNIAFWIILFYGLGEGLGSGLFKADRISGAMSTSFIIHDLLGGAGVVAILFLPLIIPKIKPHFSDRRFIGFSRIIFILGTIFLVLFSFRLIGTGDNPVAAYKGLWQRLFVLVYYLYMTIIAIMMIKKALTYEKKKIP
jgi:hypothetical protein